MRGVLVEVGKRSVRADERGDDLAVVVAQAVERAVRSP